jgi:phage terminase large subunit-like protein
MAQVNRKPTPTASAGQENRARAGVKLPIGADPTTDYARKVIDGTYPAGPHVRNACKRHLRDLDTGHERGLRFDPEKAAHALGFFRDVLHLMGGEFEGVKFHPAPWQEFVIGSLFGWLNADGYRRFRVSFIESGKGSGKSPLAAGVGLYMLVADGEARAEIYAGASKKDQAMILFRDAVAMVRHSPALQSRLTFSGGPGREWNIAHLAKGSFFRAISADDGQSGPRPHCALLDEVHEHRDETVVEMLRAGTKGRRQALIFMITNSGVDRQSICYQYHDYTCRVCAGDIEDDAHFGYVCALDEGDDPFTDEGCWPKANPTLGVTIRHDYLREQVTAARGMPGKESIVRRLNFSQWVDATSPWVSGDLWRQCETDLDLDQLQGAACWGGLDLSGTNDLSALALVWKIDGKFKAAVWQWTPADTLAERARRDRVPYAQWVKEGHLIATPGRSVDYQFIARELGELAARFNIRGVAFDPFRIKWFIRDLDAMGVSVNLIPHGQGVGRSTESSLWMPRSIDVLEKSVLDGTLQVQRNPVLTFNSASAILESDAKGNRLWVKRKSAGRIDGIVALSMALGAADTGPESGNLDEFLNNVIMVGL